jgi:hypothetical protein
MSREQSFGVASVHVGADGRVRCSAYADALPILTVDAGDCSVRITIARQTPPGPECVRFARELAAEAARFAAECERLHAAAQSGSASGTAAGDQAASAAA